MGADDFSQIQNDPQLKPVFEALLIDPKTPEKVYLDLFGVDAKSVEAYKKSNTGPWDLPRLRLYQYISKLPPGGVKNLFDEVFSGGWEVIDALYNRGRNINAAETAMKVVKVSAARAVVSAVRGDRVEPSLLSAAKNIIGSVVQYNEVMESDTEEDWTLMVKEISERQKDRTVSPVTQKAYDAAMAKFKNKGIGDRNDTQVQSDPK